MKNPLSFLTEWVKRWTINERVIHGLNRMFMYIDRFYVPNSEDLKGMSEQGGYHGCFFIVGSCDFPEQRSSR